ncbi:DUF433 domain-containing protein [uncultured Brevundimonas sp.]|uniref:DUF433 domain-containing protein n=1 Tax=uncultured Brevundimonas sp. TaxID=213418 RepID=UPI00261E7F12|nr:DUF433 domain-containing protein [uncultured Brevundimonas sp.]
MTATLERLFTAVEAGAVSGVSAKAVHNVIDKSLFALSSEPVAKPSKGSRGGRTALTGEDLVRLRIWYHAGKHLSSEARRSLIETIADQPHAKIVPAGEYLKFDVQAVRRVVEQRVRALTEGDSLVHSDRDTLGGETVFRGTRIPVHGIADMLKAGATSDELLSGYPALTRKMLEIAPLWAETHPRRGRPRKSAEPTRKMARRIPLKPDPLTSKVERA